MTFCVENETDVQFGFDAEETAGRVIGETLDYENCPYEAAVNVLLTDNEGIRAMNKEFRGIDSPTDVLSFPNVDYDAPSDFSGVEDRAEDYFDPESGELCLGDIVLSVEKVYGQAQAYGHSLEREYAFLIAHSMLHLLGYDHMGQEDAAVMEGKQEEILRRLGITRGAQAQENVNHEEKI